MWTFFCRPTLFVVKMSFWCHFAHVSTTLIYSYLWDLFFLFIVNLNNLICEFSLLWFMTLFYHLVIKYSLNNRFYPYIYHSFLKCSVLQQTAKKLVLAIEKGCRNIPASFKLLKMWVFNKPSSVPTSGGNHLSIPEITLRIQRHNPEGSAGRFIPSLFGLTPNGVYQAK